MAPTESEIRTLLASQTYISASSLPQLEAYLAAQTSGDAPYMFDAVRTLVKLYQFFPEKSNSTNIGHCCMLALLNYPATDLLALSYLIPLATFKLEPFATIQKCSEQLDSCEFIEFWKTFALLQKSDDAAIKGMATKHEGKLQSSILSTLALSYKEAPASVVLTALNITKIDAITALKNPTVESISSDSKVVVFVASQDNTKRKRVYQEGVNFTAISSLMAKMGQ
jgi:translation initiation factor 3 subunit K